MQGMERYLCDHGVNGVLVKGTGGIDGHRENVEKGQGRRKGLSYSALTTTNFYELGSHMDVKPYTSLELLKTFSMSNP